MQGRRRAAAAEVLPGAEHRVQRPGVPAVGEDEVQEARAGDLDALERRAEAGLQLLAEVGRDVARGPAQDGRQEHGRVRRVVAVPGLLGTLERRRRLRARPVGQRGHGVFEGAAEVGDRRGDGGHASMMAGPGGWAASSQWW